MQITNKYILLISPVKWDSQYVSKQHYAIELAKKGNVVYFLNPPSNKFNEYALKKNLLIIDYKPTFKGLAKMPEFVSAFLIKFEFKNIEKKLKIRFDIIWNFDSSRFFNLSKIKSVLKIAHLVDLSEDFQRPLLCKTTDLCLTTSDTVAVHLKPFNELVYKIHHGYHQIRNNYQICNEINQNKNIKVGYVGNLFSDYIDWNIAYEIVCENNDIEFYFLGDLKSMDPNVKNEITSSFSKVFVLENSFFLGSKTAEQVPNYLSLFDVQLLIYKAGKYRNQLASPHKVMEYLGSGKVIVSTYTDEYKDKRHLLEMVDDTKLYSTKFTEVINNLDFFNSIEKQNQRINFALDNTYKKQLERITKIINSHYK